MSEEGGLAVFTPEMEPLVTALASQAAISLTNMKYAEQITDLLDSLVGALSTAIDQRTPYNANHTRNDRWTNSVAITAASAGEQTVTPPTNPKRAYSDMTSKVFLLKPGENVTTTFRYSGAGMHGYVYLDKNNNGKFDVTINDNGTLPTESDLMTYSYYKGKNSLGNTLSEGANLLNPPASTIPTDMPEGFYRMRFKVDWDHIDAGGNPGPNNSLIGNGGNIIDVMVNIHGDSCTVEEPLTL